MKVGVFDSGIGGKSIAYSLEKDFPDAEILYAQDARHVPYGGREKDEIVSLTEAAIQPLLEQQCDVIVLACNTATAAAIEYLRKKYPTQQFVGLEPMVKPAAALSKTGVIAVCATPYTLSSERYNGLKERFGNDCIILEPDCSEWAEMIEHSRVDDDHVEAVVNEVLAKNADVIILACTHYHWIKEKIVKLAGSQATVIDPSSAISRRVASLMGRDFEARA